MKYKKLHKFELESEEWSGPSSSSTPSNKSLLGAEGGEKCHGQKIMKLSAAIMKVLESREGKSPLKDGRPGVRAVSAVKIETEAMGDE